MLPWPSPLHGCAMGGFPRALVATLVVVAFPGAISFSLMREHSRRLADPSDGSCSQAHESAAASCSDTGKSCDAGCGDAVVKSPPCELEDLVPGQRWHGWDSAGHGYASGLAVMRSLRDEEMPFASDLPAGLCRGDGTCADPSEADERCGKVRMDFSGSEAWEGAHVQLFQNGGSNKRCLGPKTGEEKQWQPAGAAACAAFCSHLWTAGCRAWQFLGGTPGGDCLFFTGGVAQSAAAAAWSATGDVLAWPGDVPDDVSWIGCGFASPPPSLPVVACLTAYQLCAVWRPNPAHEHSASFTRTHDSTPPRKAARPTTLSVATGVPVLIALELVQLPIVRHANTRQYTLRGHNRGRRGHYQRPHQQRRRTA